MTSQKATGERRTGMPFMGPGFEHLIPLLIIVTGISSVVTQILTIREFLSQFQGNEIVIALILFNWLIAGALGTFVSHRLSRIFTPCVPGRAHAWGH